MTIANQILSIKINNLRLYKSIVNIPDTEGDFDIRDAANRMERHKLIAGKSYENCFVCNETSSRQAARYHAPKRNSIVASHGVWTLIESIIFRIYPGNLALDP